MALEIRPAVPADLAAIRPLIERAYRGDTARQGWTHEADLLFEPRLGEGELDEIVADPAQTLLVLTQDAHPLGCVNVAQRSATLAYLALLCIEPAKQGRHLGRTLLAGAERHARETLGCKTMEMTVIEQRTELIAYYERRGWEVTGERRDFPVRLDPPFHMTVLVKSLV